MKRIVYRREYDVTIVETYYTEAPEHLVDDDSTEGKEALDEYITTNHDADYEDRLGIVEDSLTPHVTVLGDVRGEA